VRPARAAQLLLIENPRGELLLERRAERGIWGGLWCPPVVTPAKAGVQDYSRLRVIGKLPPIRHAFTHFDLTLTPVRLLASGRAAAGSKWIARKALPGYGLPAPVRRLLVP
jgi:A/G-specific adenine glycosylase